MPNQFDSASQSFKRRLNVLPIFRLFTNTQTHLKHVAHSKRTQGVHTHKKLTKELTGAQKPSTTSETTLISASPLHSPAPRSFRRVSPVRQTRPAPLYAANAGLGMQSWVDPLLLKDNFDYLGNLVDAVLYTHHLKPFPKGIFISLGTVHEGLLSTIRCKRWSWLAVSGTSPFSQKSAVVFVHAD